MLAGLLPSAVICEETRTDAEERELFAAERALIAEAAPKRRAEFTTVRVCARRALARLGRRPDPILPGPCREPRWPPGIVGSLTHCDGYRAAAVADASALLALGIDAEPHAPLPEGTLTPVTLESEREQLGRLAGEEPGTHWDRLLFSAKESVYKAWYPLTRRWLGFWDVKMDVHAGGSFTATVLQVRSTDERPAQFPGRWVVRDGLVVTATSLMRRPEADECPELRIRIRDELQAGTGVPD